MRSFAVALVVAAGVSLVQGGQPSTPPTSEVVLGQGALSQ
jgi:hypothetical protein